MVVESGVELERHHVVVVDVRVLVTDADGLVGAAVVGVPAGARSSELEMSSGRLLLARRVRRVGESCHVGVVVRPQRRKWRWLVRGRA